jgi:hypothetical protein
MAASLQALKAILIAAWLISLAGCAAMNPAPGKRELMVVGNDEKVGITDAGAYAFSGPGKDTVSIIDIGTDPLAPRILASPRRCGAARDSAVGGFPLHAPIGGCRPAPYLTNAIA